MLFFDSHEAWRPLDVEDFLGSGQVQLCAGVNCGPLGGLADLDAHPDGRFDVDGSVGNPASYRSTDASCINARRLDCDRTTGPAIYYHVKSHGAYRYIDYWIYYRFNDAHRRQFDHERDWEGVVVAIPADEPNPTSFDFVAFAAHNGVYRYLRVVLRCGTQPRPCGQDAKRVST